MNDQERKAMEMALDYIKDIRDHCACEGIECDKEDDLVEALRQALAQPEQVAMKQGWDVDTLLAQPEQEPQRPVKSYTNGEPQYATENPVTDLKAAAETLVDLLISPTVIANRRSKISLAVGALRTALAQPEQDHGFDRTASHMAGEYVDTAEREQEIFGYVDAVDRKTVYVAPDRKRWLDPHKDKEWNQFHYDHYHDTPLYTAPPSKPWVSLTDEAIDAAVEAWFKNPDDTFSQRMRAAIEAALRSKNNG